MLRVKRFLALPLKSRLWQPDWDAIVKTCNLWRNFDDIDDSWNSIDSIIEYYADGQSEMVPLAGPGHWNDPDMVSFLERVNALLVETIKTKFKTRGTFLKLNLQCLKW